jgi:hypothetical protein
MLLAILDLPQTPIDTETQSLAKVNPEINFAQETLESILMLGSCHLTALGPLPSYIYSLDPSIAP